MQHVRQQIRQARTALKAGMADYFLNRFTNPDKIRVLEKFQNESAVIDIETSGMSADAEITSIAVLKGGKIFLFVKGINLSDFLEVLGNIKLLVTYNGARFDLPFIRKCFNIDLAIPHLDLMPVLRQLGYRGGQKRCESSFDLSRAFSTGLDGRDAICLWQKWQHYQNQEAMEQLLLYNAEDVFMIEQLAIKSYNLAMKNFPLRLKLKSSIPDQMLAKEHISNFVL